MARGWTIVELLVSVAIIATLVALSFGISRSLRDCGLQAQSTANLRSLCVANQGYLADHGTYCPASDPRNLVRWHGARTSARGAFDPTKGYLADYLGKDRRVIHCPLFVDMIAAGSWELGSGGYGYNATYIGGTPAKPFQPATAGAVLQPTSTIMFATTALAVGSGLQEYPFAEPYRWVDPNGNLQSPLQPSIHFRFRGKALLGWCDGRVTAETPAEFSNLNHYGGDNRKAGIGFPGPSDNNGWFNPRR